MQQIHLRDSLADVAFEIEEAARVALDEFLDSISYAKLMDTLLVSFVGDSLVIDTLFIHSDTARVDRASTGNATETASIHDIADDIEDTSQEIDMEFKELEEIAASIPGAKKEKVKNEEKKKSTPRIRIFKNKKNSNLPDEQRLKEIEEKFK
ncbi:MAG: hypothetical protein IJU69_04535 [Bacteroidales bacterium]|nr:hypothetical protein [Bacteroidales bacterium]